MTAKLNKIEALAKKSAAELTGKELMTVRRYKNLQRKMEVLDSRARKLTEVIKEAEKDRQEVATKQAKVRQSLTDMLSDKPVEAEEEAPATISTPRGEAIPETPSPAATKDKEPAKKK